MVSDDDVERDQFVNALVHIAADVGWDLEHMREHELFRAMVVIHGEGQVRQWLLLHALRTAKRAELERRLCDFDVEWQGLRRQIAAHQRPALSDGAWWALYRRHGLERDEIGNPVLADSDWPDVWTLRCLVDYYAQTPLRT